MDEITVLKAIGATEASDFSEFCRGMRNECPAKGDTTGWRELFSLLSDCEREKLVTVERNGRIIESLQLTEADAALVRSQLDDHRGLFAGL